MDFSTLARRELQVLCKKNKIPANITTVAMIDALNALETVEGIEEILKPRESEMDDSSIESPEKNVNTQQSVPRTSYRTSTRQKPARDEDSIQQSLTRTRRGGTTSRRIARDVEEAVTKTPVVRSSRKKAPVVSLKESEKDQENGKATDEDKKAIAQTPAVAPSTLRKGTRTSTRRNVNSDLNEAKEENTKTARRINSTRRSERLSEKKPMELNLAEKETTQPIKMDAFLDDIDEVSENTALSSSELQMQEESKSSIAEENVLADLVMEEAEKLESHGSNSSNNQKVDLELSFADGEEDSKENDDKCEVDSIESVGEIRSNNEMGLNKSLHVVDFSFQNVVVPILDTVGVNNESTVDKSKTEPTNVVEVSEEEAESDFSTDSELDAKEPVNEESMEVELSAKSVKTRRNTPVKGNESTNEVEVSEEEAESNFSTDSELDAKEPVNEEESMEVELSAKSVKTTSPGSIRRNTPVKGNESTLSPLKKSLSPSPLKKSPIKSKSPLTVSILDGDKENIAHSETKFNELPRENKGTEMTKKGKTLKDVTSLRKLKKMVREELEKLKIGDKENNVGNNEEENIEEVVKTRMGLQALPDNQIEMGN